MCVCVCDTQQTNSQIKAHVDGGRGWWRGRKEDVKNGNRKGRKERRLFAVGRGNERGANESEGVFVCVCVCMVVEKEGVHGP